MSILVPVPTGVTDNSIPTGPQLSAAWTLIGPDGSRVVFNNDKDRDYIGIVTDVTGLDSPEVRESADDLVQEDGGVHGEFFYGRRPVVVSGMLLNPISADDRNRRMTKLMRASNAMRGDGTLTWTLQNGYTQFVKVRRQQPLRITGAWQKEFQLALVASDPRIYGYDLKQVQMVDGQAYCVNNGNVGMHPVITLHGSLTNPVINNFSNGGQIKLNYTISSSDSLTIDLLNRTVYDSTGQSRYSAVDFLNTEWFTLDPGVNDLHLVADASGTGNMATVFYRDAWL